MKNLKEELERLQNEQERRMLKAELSRRRLSEFIVYTKQNYYHNAFSHAVCNALDEFLKDVAAGKRPVLVLQAPPQHGKSEIVSRRFPAYAFGLYPEIRIAACSYSADLASDMNRDVQQIMLSEEYKNLFPETALGKGILRNTERFNLPCSSGYYICAGVGGPLTGKSVDIGIIDDPIKNEAEARSPAVKKTIQRWYETVFLTRLSKCSGQIIMATAWAIDDLAATVIKNNPRAKHLKFPAIDEAGNALVPELHPLEKLRETQKLLSPAQWSALYQQRPVAEGGNVFQNSWFTRWSRDTLPEFWDEIIASWDMAFKDSDFSDYVVGQVWGRKGADFYLLDQCRGRFDFVKTCSKVLEIKVKYPRITTVLVEDKANGPAVMNVLKDKIAGLRPVEPYGSKVARAQAVTSLWSSGHVFLPPPGEKEWMQDFEEEIVSFPAGAHDDQVDAMTQALDYLNSRGLAVWEVLGQ